MFADPHQALVLGLSAATVALSALSLYWQGNKQVRGPWLGLVNQLTWAGLFWVTGADISLVLCVVYGAMYARMIRKWRHDRGN